MYNEDFVIVFLAVFRKKGVFSGMFKRSNKPAKEAIRCSDGSFI